MTANHFETATAPNTPDFFCPICGKPCVELANSRETVFPARTFLCRLDKTRYEVTAFRRQGKVTSRIEATDYE